MSTQIADLYRQAADDAIPVVEAIGAEQLDGPTPCSEYDVRGLLNHLFNVLVQFEKSARGEDMDFGDEPDMLHGDWHARFRDVAEKLVSSWSAPVALTFDKSQLGLPRELVARMPVFDLVIHGWDLARATGQVYQADQRLAEDLYGFAQMMAPTGRKMGSFGPPVPVPVDAGVFENLLGTVGRDPQWRP